MATMGVRINQGLGSSASTQLADTLAKALFGDADAAREDALARSRLQTDEYTRRQIESAEEWNRIRAEQDAYKLDAQRRAEEDMIANQLLFLNRDGTPAASEAPAPVDVAALALPDVAPVPQMRPETGPVPVDLEDILLPDTAPLPVPRAHQPSPVAIEPQEVLPPVPVEMSLEPDVGFSGYPMRDDRFPEYTTAVPQNQPVVAQPTVEAAELTLRPPAELTPLGQKPLDPLALGQALKNQIAGLPDELQPAPVEVDPLASVPPELLPFEEAVTRTQIPGRVLYGDQVPLGPEAVELPEPAPSPLPELAPVDLPSQSLAPAYAGTPPVPPASPVDLPPGSVTPTPEGGAVVTMPEGRPPVTFTREQIDGLAALAATSNDPAGQMAKFSGQLDIMNRGIDQNNTTLFTGNVPAQSSVLGVEETKEVNAAKAISDEAAAPDLKKKVLVIDNIPYQLSEVDGVVHYQIGEGFTAPEAPPFPGDSVTAANLNKLVLYNRKLNSGQELTQDEKMQYGLAYNAEFGPKTTSAQGPGGQMQAQTIIRDPPTDIRLPDALVPGAPAPTAEAPAPTAEAPAPTTADTLAADQPAVPGPALTTTDVTGNTVPVKNYGGWTSPGSKPAVNRDAVETPGGAVVTTTYGEKKVGDQSGETANRFTHLMEAIPAMEYLNRIKPGEEPGALQNALDQWSSQGISQELLANPALDPETRAYGRAILNFINAPKRTESGAAVSAQEVLDYRRRFTMPPGASNVDYLSAREARTAYLRAVRLGLNNQLAPDQLRQADSDMARYGIDLDWVAPRDGSPAEEAPAGGTWKEQPDGTWKQE